MFHDGVDVIELRATGEKKGRGKDPAEEVQRRRSIGEDPSEKIQLRRSDGEGSPERRAHSRTNYGFDIM